MSADPTSLDRLHDIIAPPPVPWWPPAPGWYWVLGFLLLLLLILALRAFRHWQRNRYRREALIEWHRLAGQLDRPETRIAALTAMSVLLKRTALSAFPRAEVASLTGPAWLAFLDRTTAAPPFSKITGDLLERIAYSSIDAAEPSVTQAHDAAFIVRHWITRHQTQ
jgi:hypothetical protein